MNKISFTNLLFEGEKITLVYKRAKLWFSLLFFLFSFLSSSKSRGDSPRTVQCAGKKVVDKTTLLLLGNKPGWPMPSLDLQNNSESFPGKSLWLAVRVSETMDSQAC